MNDFFNQWGTSDKLAFASLCVSILVAILSTIGWIVSMIISRKEKREDDEQQEESQKNLKEFQKFQSEFIQYQQRVNELQFSIGNQSDLIPYFHINHNKSKIYYDDTNDNRLVVKLYLTNVGRGTAANIYIVPIREVDLSIPIYFETDPRISLELTHGVYNYFSEYFAIPNETINIEITEINNSDEQLYFLRFKINFSDVIGREYEQEFKFGYDNTLVKGINRNSISFPPRLIKDITREEK